MTKEKWTFAASILLFVLVVLQAAIYGRLPRALSLTLDRSERIVEEAPVSLPSLPDPLGAASSRNIFERGGDWAEPSPAALPLPAMPALPLPAAPPALPDGSVWPGPVLELRR